MIGYIRARCPAPLLALSLMLFGVLVWGGFNTAMHATNRLEFCLSCHEMADYIYPEYQRSLHASNSAGVAASCADCHVPRSWGAMVLRKIEASGELWQKLTGSINTPERFESRRLEMAKKVWSEMKENDSRECRNCHDYATMDPLRQSPAARLRHISAMEKGNTCIDCHKGIAHRAVHNRLSESELLQLAEPRDEYRRPMPPRWSALQHIRERSYRHLSVDEKGAPTPAASPLPPPRPKPTAFPEVAWSTIPATPLTLFYPGQASLEWTLRGEAHAGARAVKAGERCFNCHDQKLHEMGERIVSGVVLEPQPLPGKRGSIAVKLRAAYDDDYLYLHLSWPDSPSRLDAERMEPKNRVKVAMMVVGDAIRYGEEAGCWVSCHDDSNGMEQGESNGDIGKYLQHTRERSEAMREGRFVDLLRYRIDEGVVDDGHIYQARVMTGGQGADFRARLDGGVWQVEMRRRLTSLQPSDISFERTKLYSVGFAIHDDYSRGRYHHVSVGYRLGFDNDYADINAVRLDAHSHH